MRHKLFCKNPDCKKLIIHPMSQHQQFCEECGNLNSKTGELNLKIKEDISTINVSVKNVRRKR